MARGAAHRWLHDQHLGALERGTASGGRSLISVAPDFIARRVSWSADGRSILAAIGEGDADIVPLDGLIDGR